jgi:signal transduction histidine kinase
MSGTRDVDSPEGSRATDAAAEGRDGEVKRRWSQKAEAVGHLAGGIAHEINTPIQFIGDNLTFLGESLPQLLQLIETYRDLCAKAATRPLGPAEAAAQKKMETDADLEFLSANIPTSIASALDGVARVARIVQSMKTFARPEREDKALSDINEGLRETLVIATNEIKYVATVETEFGDLPLVHCALGDLNHVFLTLLTNAAYSISDVVKRAGGRGVIRVRTSVDDDHVVVAISDTGAGIPAAVQGRLFEPATEGGAKGARQGLALARSIVVEEHGGSITFTTEPGQGTTFLVRLPVAAVVEDPGSGAGAQP